MKKALILLLIIFVICALSACNNEKSADSMQARNICNFKKVFDDIDVGLTGSDDIFVDITTDVLYLRTHGSSSSGYTPIYNADGSLKLWSDYKLYTGNSIKTSDK